MVDITKYGHDLDVDSVSEGGGGGAGGGAGAGARRAGLRAPLSAT